MYRSLLSVIIVSLIGSASFAQVRSWTDRTGTYHMEAEFVSMAADVVRLKKADGTVISVNVGQLSEQDRQWIAEFRKERLRSIPRSREERDSDPSVLGVQEAAGSSVETDWGRDRYIELTGVPPALLAYWPLEGRGGQVVDRSESEFHLQAQGACQFGVTGKVGKAVQFDGKSGHFVGPPDSLNVRGSFTAAAWLKVDSDAPEGRMVVAANGDWNGYTGGWRLEVNGRKVGGAVRIAPGHEPWEYACLTDLPERGQWFHLAFVYNAERERLKTYVNGKIGSELEVDSRFAEPASIQPLCVGWSPGMGHFKGALDELLIMGRALTDEEIGHLFRYGLHLKTAPASLSSKVTPHDHSVARQLCRLLDMDLRRRSYWYWSRTGKRGVKSLLDPANRLKTQLLELLDGRSAGSKSWRQAVADKAFVAWSFPKWPLVSATAMPPTLDDAAELELHCANGEVEPVAFYVTNFLDKPLRLRTALEDFEGIATGMWKIRCVQPREKGPTERALLTAVMPVPEEGTITIPPLESRQIWIDLHSLDLTSGNYEGHILLNGEVNEGAEPVQKSIRLAVHVYPLSLPQVVPFDVYSYNYGDHMHREFLASYRLNWFTMSEPNFDIVDNQIVLDFGNANGAIADHRQFGAKLLSIYGFVQKLDKELREKHQISWEDARTKTFIVSYFEQWVAYLKSQGLMYDDYAMSLWDEPGLKDRSDEQKLLEICPLLRKADPDVQLALDFCAERPEFFEQISPYVDLFIPIKDMVIVPSRDAEGLLDALKAKGVSANSMAYKQASRQLQFKRLRHDQERRKSLWTYDQKATDAGSHLICPIDLYRRQPWLTVWNGGFDGVAFFASWYASGGGREPCKGLEAWREGVEDVQWLLLLQDELRNLETTAAVGRQSPEALAAAEAVLSRTEDDWMLKSTYGTNTLEAGRTQDELRQLAIRSILEVRRIGD